MPPLAIAAVVVLLEGLSLSALFPIIHAYTAELYRGETGGPAVWTGLLFAAVAAPKIIFNPWWGRLADRLGRRPILIFITVGSALGSAAWALVPSLAWLALARVGAGLFGAQAAICSAIATDVSTPARRAASMSALGLAFGLAFTIGPALGGFFGEQFGFHAVGWLCAGFQTLSLGLILLLLTETHPRRDEGAVQHAGRSMRQMVKSREVRAPLIVTMTMTISLSGLIASFGSLTGDLYGFSPRDTGYAFALLGLLGALTQGGVRSLVGALGERTTACAGLGLMGTGLGLIAAQPSLPWFWAAIALLAVGSAAATTCLSALLSHNVNDAEQGTAQGLNQSFTGLGRAIGFSSGGLLVAAFGLSGPYVSGAALCVFAAATVLRVPLATSIPSAATQPVTP
jgi:predicted MFS family arabinose efflux permease